jgi:hypothetical protein
MGYPMTFQRFVKRNALDQGGYLHGAAKLPLAWAIRVNIDQPGLLPPAELPATMWPYVVERVKEYERQVGNVLGDLRRLETDTMDERACCTFIAARTGVDPDVVAAVLKEFINW